MRLIIVEDQLQVLKSIKIMLKDLTDSIELIMVHCNTQDEPVDFPIEEKGWYSIKTEDELYEVCEKELEICKNDHYLLDITLFQEKQVDKRFNDYISVKLAHYIEDKKIEGVKIKFYTHPRGISQNDFARETIMWGKPIYRPKLDDNSDEEKVAQEIFVQKIKEYCNV